MLPYAARFWLHIFSPIYVRGTGSESMQVYDAVEYFAGTAWVTKAFRIGGHSMAALDVAYEENLPGRLNPMDLTTTAGMASSSLHGEQCCLQLCVILFGRMF